MLQCFAPQDVDTRDYLSKLSGQKTYWHQTTSKGRSNNPGQFGEGSSQNTAWQNHEGPVWYPQALGLIEDGQGVMFSRGRAVRGIYPDPSEMDGVAQMLVVAAAAAKR